MPTLVSRNNGALEAERAPPPRKKWDDERFDPGELGAAPADPPPPVPPLRAPPPRPGGGGDRGGAQEETARDTAESDDEMTKWAAALGVVLAAEAPVARAGDDNGGDALRQEKPASPQQEQVAAPAPLVDNEVVPAAIESQVIAALVVTEARPLRKLRATVNRSAAIEPSAAARSILPQTSTAVARAPTPPSVPLTTNIPASALASAPPASAEAHRDGETKAASPSGPPSVLITNTPASAEAHRDETQAEQLPLITNTPPSAPASAPSASAEAHRDETEAEQLRAQLKQATRTQLARDERLNASLARSALQVAELLRTKEREMVRLRSEAAQLRSERDTEAARAVAEATALREELAAAQRGGGTGVQQQRAVAPGAGDSPRATLRLDRQREIDAVESAASARRERALAAERAAHVTRLADVARRRGALVIPSRGGDRAGVALRLLELALLQRCAAERAQLRVAHEEKLMRAEVQVGALVREHESQLEAWYEENVALALSSVSPSPLSLLQGETRSGGDK